jgi:hypothetical protein
MAIGDFDFSRLWRQQDLNDIMKSDAQQAADYNKYIQSSQTAAMQASHQGSSYLAPGVGVGIVEPSIHLKALRLLKARLTGLENNYNLTPDETILTHVYQDKVYVFFVIGGKAGHFEDEAAIFPSDGLITKFRVIR